MTKGAIRQLMRERRGACAPDEARLDCHLLLARTELAQRNEAQAFARLLSEPAAREAMAAFLDKRKPDFSGM